MVKKKTEAQPTKIELAIEAWPIEKLKPYKRNSKSHPPEQVDMIAKLIAAHGFDVPIVVDKKGTIIKGHGRWLAAQRLGLERVPVIVKDMTAAKAAEARIADNRVGEFGWDFDALVGDVVANLKDGLDVGLIGFSLKDLGLEQAPDESGVVRRTDGTGVGDDSSEPVDQGTDQGTGEIELGEGAHTCPRCSFTFG